METLKTFGSCFQKKAWGFSRSLTQKLSYLVIWTTLRVIKLIIIYHQKTGGIQKLFFRVRMIILRIPNSKFSQIPEQFQQMALSKKKAANKQEDSLVLEKLVKTRKNRIVNSWKHVQNSFSTVYHEFVWDLKIQTQLLWDFEPALWQNGMIIFLHQCTVCILGQWALNAYCLPFWIV